MNNTDAIQELTDCFKAIHEFNPGDLYTQHVQADVQVTEALRLLEGLYPREVVDELICAFRSCLSRDYGGFNNPL